MRSSTPNSYGRSSISLRNGFYLERHAAGVALENLCTSLAILASQLEGIDIRTPLSEGKDRTRVDIIRHNLTRKGRNNKILRKSTKSRNELLDHLAVTVPSLTRPRGVIVEGVRPLSESVVDESNDYCLELALRYQDVRALSKERDKTWGSVCMFVGERMFRGSEDQFIRVGYGQNLSPDKAAALSEFTDRQVHKLGKFVVDLEPALRPVYL